MRLSGRVAALGATCALLGACTGESPETVASVPTAATAATSTSTAAATAAPTSSGSAPSAAAEAPAVSARRLADAVAIGGDPDAVREALATTAAGSLANAYVLHRSYVAEAGRDSGLPAADSEISELPGGRYKLCDDPADETTCTVLGDFKADSTGKVVAFTVDGKPLQGRLTVGDGQEVKAGGGKFTFLTAYQAIPSDSLFVAVRMESGKKSLSPDVSLATYRSPDGTVRGATDAMGPTRLDAGSDAIAVFRFDGVKPEGKVILEGCIDDQCEGGSLKTEIPVS